jgi:polyferredoxin
MLALTPANSAALADVVLVSHAGIVAFAVLGQLLFMLGGGLGWRWVRVAWIRLAHLALIAFVLVQSWLGASCPLTIWEQMLRREAGQTGYTESFIEHWFTRLIFFDAPAWVFVLVYTLFGAIVLLTWRWVPPRWPQSRPAIKKSRFRDENGL